MGYDISYHPINEQEIQEWYFDVLFDHTRIDKVARAHNLDEFHEEKYRNTIRIAGRTEPNELFDKSHGYYIAVVQGFFRRYFYVRGAAFSFALEKNPEFVRYTKRWEEIVPDRPENPVQNRISENYSSGVFIPADRVAELLDDYYRVQPLKEALDKQFSNQRITVFLNALRFAKSNNLGLLEATEVIEPNPQNLSRSSCYTNLTHCDPEGQQLYEKATIEELRILEEQQRQKKEAEKSGIQPPEKGQSTSGKKGFWQRLMGKLFE